MPAYAPASPSPVSAGPPTRRTPASDPRHLLALEGMPREVLMALLEDAAEERALLRGDSPDRSDLAGCSVALAFIEDSTRTRTSFDLAARQLGARTLSFSPGGSSLSKGESLLDTTRLFEAMGVQLLVVRHPISGVASWLAARLSRMAVLNGGDGMHEHPTQGLLDLLTLRDAWGGRFDGRRLVIVGDIQHSRVARSAIAGLTTLGTEVTLCAPGTLMPAQAGLLGCSVADSLDDALDGADGVMALRLQHERMERGLLPVGGEYARRWGITEERVRRMRPDAPVLHPGPVNRGVEIPGSVADGASSMILDQVANGVAVRRAVLRRSWLAWKAAE